jgi:hypothetical protein
MITRSQLRRARDFARADRRTDEQVVADLKKAMDEPLDVTLEKSCAVLKVARGYKTLVAQMATEYAQARIWHIENKIPLPPFSNGNYRSAWVDDPFKRREMRLIADGNERLRKAWEAKKRSEA